MNVYDSQKIVDILTEKYGIQTTNILNDADLLIMNTCSVRDKAESKVFSELGRWRLLKNKNQDIIIGITGCIASQMGNTIRARAPYVDLIIGPQNIHQLPDLIDKLRLTRKAQIDITFKAIEKFDNLPEPTTKGSTALVSIMEGCNKYCSYCIVPFTRGREISRDFSDVLNECSTLVKLGVKEITLLGQNVNAYKSLHNGIKVDLASLLEALAKVPELKRLRFMTSHPKEFSGSLFDAYSNIKKLANHLHLPIQSGSNRILKLMRRGYTVEIYSEIIKRLRDIRPEISLTSDFIVGFPGETDEDFTNTLELVKELKFDQSYSFMYSRRPGTKASILPDQVPLAVKKKRLLLLQEVLNDNSLQFSQLMINKTYEVLFTEKAKLKGFIAGRADNNHMIIVPGGNNLIGKILWVQVKDMMNNCLVGELLDAV